jgi:hypothetical protein
MLKELKKVNKAELSATSKDILVNGDNHKVSNLAFSLLWCLPKVQYTAMSLLHCSPSSHFLQPTITCRLVIALHNAAFRQSVPSQILFSVTYGFSSTY